MYGRSCNRAARARAAVEAELEVLNVAHRLVDQPRDVIVVERIHDPAPVALSHHQADVTQKPELMGDRGLLHC